MKELFVLEEVSDDYTYTDSSKWEWDFVVYSDALKLDLGCVLMQNGKVVLNASRQLKIHKQTMLLMIWSWR